MVFAFEFLFLRMFIVEVFAEYETPSTPYQLIETLSDAVNNQNIWEYISLFESGIQEEMKEYMGTCGSTDFFSEQRRDIISIASSSDEVAIQEKDSFSDVLVLRVRENVQYSTKYLAENSYKSSGIQENYYVLIKEDNSWKIARISAAESESNRTRASVSCPLKLQSILQKIKTIIIMVRERKSYLFLYTWVMFYPMNG